MGGGGPVRGGGVRLGGQGGWERRIETFVKIKKKRIFLGEGGRVGGGGDGCEWRSKVFVKIQKKNFEGGGVWVGVGWGGPIRGWVGGGEG